MVLQLVAPWCWQAGSGKGKWSYLVLEEQAWGHYHFEKTKGGNLSEAPGSILFSLHKVNGEEILGDSRPILGSEGCLALPSTQVEKVSKTRW